MPNYRVITDATCDMNQDVLEAHHIDCIPMEVTLGDRVFLHYPDFRNCSVKDFYDALRKKVECHTAQITPQNYLDFFTPILKQGEDILYVCFSSGLSGTYQSSVLAVKQLQEEFPDRKIYTIDSLSAQTGEGVLAVEVAKNKEKGMSIEDNAKWLEENRLRMSHYFTVNDLFFLHRGGRVGMATAIAGSALKIKPILTVDKEGKLPMIAKSHGRKASMSKLISLTQATGENLQDQVIYISHADSETDVATLKQMVQDTFHPQDVVICDCGPIIGCHVGPDFLAVFSFGKTRTNDAK